jgi:hypothetical protein
MQVKRNQWSTLEHHLISPAGLFLAGWCFKTSIFVDARGGALQLHVRDPCLSIKGLLAKQASTSFACIEIPFESAFGGTEFV